MAIDQIKLLRNNSNNNNKDDLDWVNEFYKFLMGEIPNGIYFGKGHAVKLSPNKAYSIIYYLQEHFSLLPDTIEQCSKCKDLYDSCSSGYYSDENEKFYCDNCMPEFVHDKRSFPHP
ncbi:MAG: hypothetical protein ABFC84_11985 [Veillonellales bacterium]